MLYVLIVRTMNTYLNFLSGWLSFIHSLPNYMTNATNYGKDEMRQGQQGQGNQSDSRETGREAGKESEGQGSGRGSDAGSNRDNGR